jgi:hypothetical protein
MVRIRNVTILFICLFALWAKFIISEGLLPYTLTLISTYILIGVLIYLITLIYKKIKK